MIPLNSILDFIPPIFAVGGAPAGDVTGTWGGLLFYIGIALGVSFLCSVLEAILLSTSLSHVELQVEKGSRAGLLMQKHKTDVERPISAILTLNTVAHTVGAAGAGAQAVAIFGDAWFGVISAVLTILILVFSEIIPKTIGATYWKELNAFAAYTIEIMVKLLLPAVWLLEKTTQMLKTSDDMPTISRMEIEAMARIGANEGQLEPQEGRIVRNLLHLRAVQVEDVMTPRTVVLAFQQDMSVKDILENHTTLPYSRLPIYDESVDDISGFVLRHDIFHAYATGEPEKQLKDMCRAIKVVPETNSVASALDQFVDEQEHILLVIDEYGGTAGILTMEDTIETLLGIEITDESDLVADLRKMAQQRYKSQQELLQRITQPIPRPPLDPPVQPETGD